MSIKYLISMMNVAYGIKEFDSELYDRAVITKHKWGCKEGERQDENAILTLLELC